MDWPAANKEDTGRGGGVGLREIKKRKKYWQGDRNSVKSQPELEQEKRRARLGGKKLSVQKEKGRGKDEKKSHRNQK